MDSGFPMSDEKRRKMVEDYGGEVARWLDEAHDVMDAFRSMFPEGALGDLKYIFTVHAMMERYCIERRVPPEAFHEFVPTLVGFWHAAGKPPDFDFGVVTVSHPPEEKGGTE